MKKFIPLMLVFTMVLTFCCSCGQAGGKAANPNLDTSEEVTLKVCGPWTSFKALETVSDKFSEIYPNCTIEYEYLQDYEDSVVKRLENNLDTVDMFMSTNIQSDSTKLPYAMELFSEPDMDLSDTNEGLIKNFTYITTDTQTEPQIYCIPIGGELRGMYVNKTLLSSLDIEVPKNLDELMAACEKLKEAGYVPMNGNPGIFAQRLLYPYVCNLIANSDNYQDTYDRVNSCEPGVSELFREPMQITYDLMSNYYYDYKYVESELNMYTDLSDEGQARDFFNIKASGDDYAKVDDIGTVAFTSGTLTQNTTMEKIKADYHSAIDYEFIMAPVSAEGGFAYFSPGQGLAVNKDTLHKDWAIEFMNYVFSKDINTEFAEENNYIPNTADSFEVIKENYDLPADRISELGQVTFDYPFYSVIEKSLVNISKGNNPKYMDTDAAGNQVLYSFDYYMEQLEADFAEQRSSEE